MMGLFFRLRELMDHAHYYLGSHPLTFAACVVGIVFCAVRWKRHPHASFFGVLGFGALVILPLLLRGAYGIFNQIFNRMGDSLPSFVGDLVGTVLILFGWLIEPVGLVLLLFAIIGWPTKSRTTPARPPGMPAAPPPYGRTR